ncbi:MAG TPA: ATP-grasp domain-containing protein [Anaerovoracaceae bacterium]|nr:ATP-grasp domain-containing protein [Anaerovoracaceae bacterium]
MKRCCIIYNEPREGALADELDVLDQVDHIEKHLTELGMVTYRKGISTMFMEEVASLASEKPDFVFNLVESINNKGEISYFIPALLNMYSIPYSGNPLEAIFITSNKTLAGTSMRNAGIRNPRSYSPSQYNLLKSGNKYIVKPIWEDGSMGITGESVFECKPGFHEKLTGLDDSHWFIEDFIDGREFNISLLTGKDGPEVLPPAEIVFVNFDDNKPKIVDFKAKWELDSFEYTNTVREFPASSLSRQLNNNLKEAAFACWNLFGLKGYARVDVRTDSNDNVFIIEVNANPCISPDSGFVAATREAGYPFINIIQRIISDLNK